MFWLKKGTDPEQPLSGQEQLESAIIGESQQSIAL
jgi:hypothetical protein